MEVMLAILGSGALSALISGVFAVIPKQKDRKNGVAAGVRILLYDRIKYLGFLYVGRKEISGDQLEDLIRMHEIYHGDLGGNGFLDNLMQDVKKLPVIK